jgi:hypothetical protein
VQTRAHLSCRSSREGDRHRPAWIVDTRRNAIRDPVCYRPRLASSCSSQHDHRTMHSACHRLLLGI